MIIDSFPYFNEKELLELRINLLYDYVDRFIIFDANRTHAGKIKEFTCKDTLNKLNLNSNKISVIELDMSNYDNVNDPWVRERLQRDSLSSYIEETDICIISDCDEIINPLLINEHKDFLSNNKDTLLFLPFYYLQHRADLHVSDDHGNLRGWNAAYVCTGKLIKKQTPSSIRENLTLGGSVDDWPYPVSYIITPPGKKSGWHFTWMGDIDRIITKKNNFAHAFDEGIKDYEIDLYNPDEGTTDYLGREDHILTKFDVSLLPGIIDNLPTVKEFLLPEQNI